MTQKRPVGLLLINALLLIVALRAIGWTLVGSLLSKHSSLTKGLLSLSIMMIFLISAIGLLRLREWARWLTLTICSLYFGSMLLNVIAMGPHLTSNRINLSLGLLNGAEAISTLFLAWWYLNREDVRRLFQEST